MCTPKYVCANAFARAFECIHDRAHVRKLTCVYVISYKETCKNSILRAISTQIFAKLFRVRAVSKLIDRLHKKGKAAVTDIWVIKRIKEKVVSVISLKWLTVLGFISPGEWKP